MLSSVAIEFGYGIRKELVISQGSEQQKIGQAKVSLAHLRQLCTHWAGACASSSQQCLPHSLISVFLFTKGRGYYQAKFFSLSTS